MLVSTRQLLLDAQKRKYAVPAFNVHNMETIQTVIEAAAELKSPIIVAATPGTMKYAGAEFFIKLVEICSEKYDIPIGSSWKLLWNIKCHRYRNKICNDWCFSSKLWRKYS